MPVTLNCKASRVSINCAFLSFSCFFFLAPCLFTIFVRSYVFPYVSLCTLARRRRLREPSNRRTRGDERGRRSMSSSLLRSAAYLYSRRVKKRTANSRERSGCVKKVLQWESPKKNLSVSHRFRGNEKKSHFRTLSTPYKSRRYSLPLRLRYYYLCPSAVKLDFHTREISSSRFFSPDY